MRISYNHHSKVGPYTAFQLRLNEKGITMKNDLKSAQINVAVPDDGSKSPKLSFGSWAFSFGPYSNAPWSFHEVCSYLSKAGYDGVEINGFRPHPHPEDFDTDLKCQKLLQMINGFQLEISGYAPDFRKTPPSEVSNKDYLREIELSRVFCERMGIKTLRVDSVSPPVELDNAEYEVRFDRMAKAFGAAAERLKQSDVKLVWEFEPGFWLNKPSEVLRMIEAVQSDNFGILFDTSHAYTSAVGRRQTGKKEILVGRAAEFAKLLAPYTTHLHLIDSIGELHNEETSEHLPFGTGHIDFDAIIENLGKSATALDWWTVDFCFWPTAEIDGLTAVPFVRNLIKKHTNA